MMKRYTKCPLCKYLDIISNCFGFILTEINYIHVTINLYEYHLGLLIMYLDSFLVLAQAK